MTREELKKLKIEEPERFFILWRQRDPKGCAMARLGASYDEVMAAKRCGSADFSRMRANHIALVRRWTEMCNLEPKKVRKFLYF